MNQLNITNIYILFVFCGQKIDWDNRNLYLYNNDINFKNSMDNIDLKLKEKYGISAIEYVLDKVKNNERVKDQIILHFMLFNFQVSLYQYLIKYITPSLIMGFSCGEIAGLYCSGAIDFDTACDLIYKRGLYISKTLALGGAITYFLLSDEEFKLKQYYKLYNIELCAYVSPKGIAYCGNEDEIDKLNEDFKNDNVVHRKSFVKGCFHTSKMELIKDEILNLQFKSSKPTIEYLSCANLKHITDDYKFDQHHLYANIRNPLLISQAYQNVLLNIENNNNINKMIVFEMSTISKSNYIIDDIIPYINCNKFSNDNTLVLPSKPITDLNYIINQISMFINR